MCLDTSGVTLRSLRGHSGITSDIALGWLWGDSEVILKSFWSHFGILLRSLRGHFGIGHLGLSLRSHRCHFEIIQRWLLGPCEASESCEAFEPGSFWDHCWVISGISRKLWSEKDHQIEVRYVKKETTTKKQYYTTEIIHPKNITNQSTKRPQ